MCNWVTHKLVFILCLCLGTCATGAQNSLLSGTWSISDNDSEKVPDTGWEAWDVDETLPNQVVFWLKTTITNTTSDTVSKILYLGNTQDVDVIVGTTSGVILKSYKTGTLLPASERDMKHGVALVGLGYSAQAYIDVPPGDSYIYLRYHPKLFQHSKIEVTLYSIAEWYRIAVEQNAKTFLIQGLVVGALLIISIYHFLIFIIRRDWPFFWYALYALSVGVGMFLEGGVLQTLMLTERPFVFRMIWDTQVLSMTSAMLYFIFMRSFLDLDKFMPSLDRFVTVFLYIYIPLALLSDLRYVITLQHSPINFIGPILVLLLGLYFVFRLIRTGDKLAMYFATGSLVLFVSVFTNTIASILVAYGVIDDLPFPRIWFTEIGILLEILIFSLGLGYRLRLKDKEQENSLTRLRTKISSDLHDDVGSMLTGLSMQSNVMSYTAEGPMKDKLKQISEISRNALETMRDTVWAIDGRQDNFESLIDKMRDFAEVNLPEDKLSYRVETSGMQGGDTILPDIRQQTYLIYKEAISNAIKYCNGDHINIQLNLIKDQLQLIVVDNGTLSPTDYSSGQGISNMKMRATQLGGELTVSFDQGCRVEFILSL